MPDILSQSEIDALLSAISTGEMDADELKQENKKKEKVYDFKRALRFSKDQMRSLSRIHENFSRILTTYFSSQLRTYVEISVASVDQLPYEEFIRSVPSMTIMNVLTAEPLEGSILIEVNPNIAYAMLDRLLGGLGTSINKIDNLTEIETTLISQIFKNTLPAFKEAWGSVIDIEPEMQSFEVNPQFLQIASPNDTVVVITLSTTIGEASGMMNICLPHVVIEPVIPKLSQHYWMSEKKKDRSLEDQHKIEKSIRETEVELRAVLGRSNLTVKELATLSAGDIIRLDQLIDSAVSLQVGEETRFLAQTGKKKSQLAVQIMEVLPEGDKEL